MNNPLSGRTRLTAGAGVLALTTVGLVIVGSPVQAPTPVRRTAIVVFSIVMLLGAARCIGWIVQAIDRRRGGERRPKALLQPIGPPIEQIAGDLRRLLWRHDVLVTLAGNSWRAFGQVRAAEVAITERALQAARALGVDHPEPPVFGALQVEHLRPLLRALADAGLVLPLHVGLLEPGSHF